MTRDEDLAAYVTRVRRVAAATGAEAALGSVAGALASRHGIDLRRARTPLQGGAGEPLVPPDRLARAELLGAVYEALRPQHTRRTSGAFYTPEVLARPLVAAVLDGLSTPLEHVRVCDPAVGGGAFLLAAARNLVARGADPRAVVGRGLFGVDIDPLAVAVTRTALTLVAGGLPPAAGHVLVADALTEGVPAEEVDAVVGNPPFLSQLSAATARPAAYRAALRRRFGPAAGGYADTANVFLLLALGLVREGGRVGLILPDSFLVARDAAPTRAAAARAAALESLWVAGGDVFGAGVRVCAPVFAVGSPQGGVRRRLGTSFTEQPVHHPRARLEEAPSWSGLVADLLGVPTVSCAGLGTLGEHCQATADFRDQYYGLVPYVFDEDDGRADDERYPPLMTSGLIDPARSLWGLRTTRFAKRTFARPRVRLQALRRDSPLSDWSVRRRVPKILLATQTRVLEAAVDEAGAWLPCTPTITVEASPGSLWHIGAALNSPPLSALALHAAAGAALSPDAIKLRASDVTALPAPRTGADWDAGARALQAAAGAVGDHERLSALEAAGRALCRAYRVAEPEPLLRWWLDRLPRRPVTPAVPCDPSR